jgi:glutathione S-transferase
MIENKTSSRIVLYDWPASPFCAKVRAVLERKGLEYERAPAIPNRRRIERRGGVGKVPALEIDGEFLVDSTDIVHHLERRFPSPAVMPAGPADRALCHALEDWTDESLYFFGLYFNWHEPAGRRATRGLVGRTLLGKLMFWPMLRRIERQLWGQGTGRKSPAHVRSDLERNLDAVEGLLGRGDYLLGAGPWLCDYALMSQLVYIGRAAALTDLYRSRPRISAFLERMKRDKEALKTAGSAPAPRRETASA